MPDELSRRDADEAARDAERPTVTRHDLAETRTQEPLGSSPSDATSWQAAGSRYRIIGEIARGGMGVVLRAVDRDIQRPLAVKVMRLAESAEAQQRFLAEARITGQLQHPGIPPVHEIGRLQDGRPFFSMKLIEGRTLSHLLVERESVQADLPRLLKIVEQIAQTLAYAHARGVIHRDLKPANVMVGAFGEVQVMDWGLARKMGDDDRRAVADGSAPTAAMPAAADGSTEYAAGALAETGEAPPAPRDADRLTQAGQILGTLAYMPPEQARGETDSLDERCDVFGLGAILGVVLTGRPPFEGARADVLRRAQAGDLAAAFTQLDGCGGDPELVDLAKACLQPAADDRPRDAGVVAERIGAYLASVQQRLKEAEIERAAAQAKAAAERRRRRVSMLFGATLLVLIAGASAAVIWYQRQQALADVRRAQVEDQIVAALDEVQRLREGLIAELEEPESALALHDDAAQWPGRLAAAESLVQQAEALSATSGLHLAAPLLKRLAATKSALQTDKFHHQQAVRLEQIRQEAAALVDGDYDTSHVGPQYAGAFREAKLDVESEGADAGALASRIGESAIRWQWIAALDHWAEITTDSELQERLLQVARAADPDPSWRDRFRKPAAWRDLKRLTELAAEPAALEQSPTMIANLAYQLDARGGDPVPLLRRALLRHPNDFWLQFQLGLTADDLEEAAGGYRAALAVRPRAVVALLGLGNAQIGARRGMPEEIATAQNPEAALHTFRRAVEVAPDYYLAHNNLGNALMWKGELDAAIAEYRTTTALRPDFVGGHFNLAQTLRMSGALEEAVEAYRRCIENDSEHRLPEAYVNMGGILAELGRHAEAMEACQQALAIDPDHALARNNLGNALSSQGDVPAAIAEYRRAVAADPKLALAHFNLGVALAGQDDHAAAAAAFRGAVQCNPRYPEAHLNLGVSLDAIGELEGAAEAFRRATRTDPKSARAHAKLGNALIQLKQFEAGIAACRKALALDPQFASAHYNLGNALMQQGQLAKAVAAFRAAVQWNPDEPVYHNNLGAALDQDGQLDEAITAFQRAVEVDPEYADGYANWGNALRKQYRFEQALTVYRKALDAEPEHAASLCGLGFALAARNDTQAALAAFRRGHASGSQQQGWAFPSAQWVQLAARLLELESRENVNARERFELGYLCGVIKKQHAAAAEHYAQGMADPQTPGALRARFRYDAAAMAALAAAGNGADAAELDDAQRSKLRKNSLDWLREEFKAMNAALQVRPDIKPQAVQLIAEWLEDPQFESVRNEDLLVQLPPQEQDGWHALWSQMRERHAELQAD